MHRLQLLIRSYDNVKSAFESTGVLTSDFRLIQNIFDFIQSVRQSASINVSHMSDHFFHIEAWVRTSALVIQLAIAEAGQKQAEYQRLLTGPAEGIVSGGIDSRDVVRTGGVGGPIACAQRRKIVGPHAVSSSQPQPQPQPHPLQRQRGAAYQADRRANVPPSDLLGCGGGGRGGGDDPGDDRELRRFESWGATEAGVQTVSRQQWPPQGDELERWTSDAGQRGKCKRENRTADSRETFQYSDCQVGRNIFSRKYHCWDGICGHRPWKVGAGASLSPLLPLSPSSSVTGGGIYTFLVDEGRAYIPYHNKKCHVIFLLVHIF